MNMLKLILAGFCVLAFFCTFLAFPAYAFAQIIITEIMYDVPGTDTGREWIEVKNSGSEVVDLGLWKLFEANVAHKISAAANSVAAGSILPAGGYAIIADNPDKFLTDNPGFSGLLLDSAFSLSSAGETLAARNPEGVDVDTVAYSPEWGAGGDGFSLQKTNSGVWISAAPTIGLPTSTSQSETPPIDDSAGASNESESSTGAPQASGNLSAHENQAVENRSPDIVEFEVTSGRNRIGIVGSPLEFEAKVRKIKGTDSPIEHRWSFGDGSSAYGPVASHAYAFPGRYNVVLNSRALDARAVSRISVDIFEADISISSASAGVVEIWNRGERETNIGGMSLAYGKVWISIARDTLIDPGAKIIVPFSAITQGVTKSVVDEPVRLINPAGRTISEFVPMFAGPYIELPLGMNVEMLTAALERAFSVVNQETL